MFSKFSKVSIKAFCVLATLGMGACVSEVPRHELTVSEQIQVDTKNAEALEKDFQRQAIFIDNDKAEKFLKVMAEKILATRIDFKNEKITVKIHEDGNANLSRFFAFPGITISMPASFLVKVEFENELAGAIAFELSNLVNRDLARKVEANEQKNQKNILFGPGSVFDLRHDEREQSIKLATKFLYDAGFDTRGVASIFKRYTTYYIGDSASDSAKKEVVLSIREAQRAKSEYLPQMKPVVRSGEFIQFKKDYAHARTVKRN